MEIQAKDLIIIGGSAAAVSAAIYATRSNLNVAIITKDIGGQIALTDEIGNYPGFSTINGMELVKEFKKHLDFYNIKIEDGVEVVNVGGQSGDFKIEAKNGEKTLEYKSKTVLVATGVRHKRLGIPGEEKFYQKGVSYCANCDGPLFKNKIVAVIGGGNSALESSLMLAGIAKKIYILTINSEMRGEKVMVDKLKKAKNVEFIYNVRILNIIGENMVNAMEYEDLISGKLNKIALDGIFVNIGMIPNSEFLTQVNKDKTGAILVNEKCETNISGLFAAGDVTNILYKQIIVAAGHGATAALSVVDYLNKI
ncbi:MAG: hypothetical protein US76_03450 [Parcubacteria group bacterium GW2011_GWA2_38_13b]|nr:MAG: hypothetical protein US76_03450 [Parcubacteria group bacterium GW2011_GWA2_38_13b]